MAANTTPLFGLTPIVWIGVLATANTDRTGATTTNMVTLGTAGTDGTRIDYVRVVATGTVTAGVVRLFIHDGSNARLVKEIMITATTPSTSVETFVLEFVFTRPLVLPSGYSLRVTTHNTEGFHVYAYGASF